MTNRTPAQVFPPGDFVREEMEERGWSQTELAQILGRTNATVNELLSGKRGITPDMANALAEAFGTDAALWMNLESAYRLAQTSESDKGIARRAKLYTAAPVNDMIKRGWINATNDIDELEKSILSFTHRKSLDDAPSFGVAARKSTTNEPADYTEHSPSQIAWFSRAMQMANAISVEAKYTIDLLRDRLGLIRSLAIHPEEIRKLPKVLSQTGIRFVIVEHLPKSKIDGAAFWLDDTSPAIALSIRYDRIDCFWHTLVHELAHIFKNHANKIDSRLVGSDRAPITDEEEKLVDRMACGFLVPQDQLQDFINRVRPLYAKTRIAKFAERIQMHPGIVVGQLQHRDEIGYQHSRETLVKVRHIITAHAFTDGWGEFPSF